MDFEEFLKLCKDADELISKLLVGPSKLQGKRPNTLKAAAVWYLARKRDLHVTLNHLYHVYGVRQPRLIATRKLIEKEAARTQTAQQK